MAENEGIATGDLTLQTAAMERNRDMVTGLRVNQQCSTLNRQFDPYHYTLF